MAGGQTMHPHTVYLLLFIAVAWVMFFLVGDYAYRRFDSERTPSRFPERSAYEWTELRDLAITKPYLAAFYVCPVLFPLDLIVMLLLAASMGLASGCWLRTVGGNPTWAYLLPAIYLAADLVEDGVLAALLRHPERITEISVRRLKGITKLKMVGIVLTIVQTFGVFLVYVVRA
jgi:hypothetical protein